MQEGSFSRAVGLGVWSGCSHCTPFHLRVHVGIHAARRDTLALRMLLHRVLVHSNGS